MSAQSTPLLEVKNLSVGFAGSRSIKHVTSQVSFDVMPGEVLAIVGESGSGKSVTALSIMRLIEKEGGVIENGQILFTCKDNTVIDLARASLEQLQKVRGDDVSMIFQEPMTSLNPVLTIGEQLMEVFVLHRNSTRSEAYGQTLKMLEKVHMSDPEKRINQYPHELSGGMRQRVMIAMALACRPKLLIADEPTTALDVTIQAEILDLIAELQRETGTAVIFITHDMGVVAQTADRVVVMKAGKVVEIAETKALFNKPVTAYSRQLLNAVPRLGSGSPHYQYKIKPGQQEQENLSSAGNVLEVENLVIRFPVYKGMLKKKVANVHAVENVSFHLKPGETLGLVGESGSGKSTIGRSVMKLVQATEGTIRFGRKDVSGLNEMALRPYRKNIQMVFQDPYASLNPRLSISELITEPLAIHHNYSKKERRDIAADLLARVSLPLDALDRYPHQFSGGQRQRVCIARALSSKPKVIVADECVSALDVSVQAQVLELMQELQEEERIAYLFISHDLSVVEQISHRVAVLNQGKIVEMGNTNDVLHNPRHQYTRHLLSAVPVADPACRGKKILKTVKGEKKSPIKPVGYLPEKQVYQRFENGHIVLE
ncbi:MAG: ABC transporter ATP-binding protein [Alcaligenaceae bacterium]|nr:ABC transporter ATP-binding protein [Alcaligenaceae bacterium]